MSGKYIYSIKCKFHLLYRQHLVQVKKSKFIIYDLGPLCPPIHLPYKVSCNTGAPNFQESHLLIALPKRNNIFNLFSLTVQPLSRYEIQVTICFL